MSLVAGLDAGTQSVKLLVYDAQARAVLASASTPLELFAGDDGSREQLPSDWVRAMEDCFSSIDAALRKRIVALAVSGQQHGFVALDETGAVLAPAKLWNDTSTTLECDEIMDAVGGPAATINLAGNPILAGYTASKLPWTRKHRANVYARLAKILLPHDYLNFVLTGQYWMEHGDASGTGWLDVRTRRWSTPLLQATAPERDLSRCLPPLVRSDALFAIAPAAAARLGLSSTTQVAAGGGDNMMAAIGTGCVKEGRLTLSLGTSGTLFAYSERPIVSDSGAWAAFCSSTGGWLPLICTMNCTVATEHVASLFGFNAREGDGHILTTKPGANGLVFLPFLNGERTPDLPLGRGVLAGLDAHNMCPSNFYRAAMEGATYSLKYGFDAFTAAGMRFETIALTGGGANSASWRQMVADVFALPVEVPGQVEGAAFGAALQALHALETSRGNAIHISDVTAQHVVADPSLATAPDPANGIAYQNSYWKFLEHLDAVAPLYHRRND